MNVHPEAVFPLLVTDQRLLPVMSLVTVYAVSKITDQRARRVRGSDQIFSNVVRAENWWRLIRMLTIAVERKTSLLWKSSTAAFDGAPEIAIKIA